MNTILELREKRAKAWEGAKAFLDSKRGNDGLLSGEDTQTYERMEADVMNLGKEIERLLDATQLVQEWIDGTYPNYGMCTSPEVETSSTYTYRHNAAWASKEHATTGFRPYLLITYE